MTIAEIARLAGVSRGTVDRVVNNRGSVNPDKKARILEIIEENGFVPNKAGKILAVRKKNLKLGFILFDSANSPFFRDLEKGIDSFERDYREYGVEVYREYTSMSDPASQIDAVDRLLGKGVSGLAIIPLDSDPLRKKLAKLGDEGVPVVTVNSDLSDSGRLVYVGSDYLRTGETAAGILGLIKGGKGKVAIVMGSRNVLCHTEREKGFRQILKENYPGIEVVDTVLHNDEDEISFEVTKNLLSNEELDSLYLVSGGTRGAIKAIKASGKAVTVVSHDINDPAFIEDGTIKASIYQNPFEQGRRPLKILYEKLGFGTDPDNTFHYTKSEVVIRENLKEFLEKETKGNNE